MALATQCPHCQTTFRVAHDQLKLRAGLVRCGACKQIFNGIENLIRLDENGQAEPVPAQPAASAAAAAATDTPASPGDTDLAALLKGGAPAVPDSPAAEGIQPPPAQAENPMLRMTLLDFAHVPRTPSTSGATDARASTGTDDAPAVPPEEDPVEQAINDLQSKPWRDTERDAAPDTDPLDQADAAEYDEPAFVRQARRRHRLAHLTRNTMGIASAVLVLLLLLQTTVALRDQLAARFPSSRPALQGICGLFGCQVALPARIDAVSIESSELQTESGNSERFTLSVLLRNQGQTTEAWPHIELTLNDMYEKALLRRVFAPRDYLPPGFDPLAGFAARSEQMVKVQFELSQLQASGYRVYVFYP